MTEAERELVEAIMARGKDDKSSVLVARNKVARERLDKEIPGWEKEAKSAYFFYLRAEETWRKWERRLDEGGVHREYGYSKLVEDWREEYKKTEGR